MEINSVLFFCQHWCKLIANSSDFTVRFFGDVNREKFLFLAVPVSFGCLSTAISNQNFKYSYAAVPMPLLPQCILNIFGNNRSHLFTPSRTENQNKNCQNFCMSVWCLCWGRSGIVLLKPRCWNRPVITYAHLSQVDRFA